MKIQEFEKKYSHLTTWVRTDLEPIIHIHNLHTIVVAPIKCGKRLIMEYMSLRNNSGTGNKVIHFYLSALNRKDERNQLDELKDIYGFEIFIARKHAQLLARIKQVEHLYDIIYVHLNESDYGTGNDSCLSKIFDQMIAINKVKVIAYSATQEEAMYSYFGNQQFSRIVYYNPPPTYRGAKWYLDNNKVKEATPFWDAATKTFEPQGIECLDMLKASNKTFGVVRFPWGMKTIRDKGDFEHAVRTQYGFNVVFVDGDNSFDWSQSKDSMCDLLLSAKRKTVLVVCQTITRSTEVYFHDEITFWHGAERKNAAANTIMQADGRPIYYDGTYSNPVDITIYSSLEVFEYYAGKRPIGQLQRKISHRVTNTTGGKRGRPSKYIRKQVVLNRMPTIAEYNIEAAKLGGLPRKNIDTRSVSGNFKYDVADYVLTNSNNKLAGAKDDRQYGTVIAFDAPSLNVKHKSSWSNTAHLHGKFVLLIDIPRKIVITPTPNILNFKAKNSVYG